MIRMHESEAVLHAYIVGPVPARIESSRNHTKRLLNLNRGFRARFLGPVLRCWRLSIITCCDHDNR
jgi:hypothetical protein